MVIQMNYALISGAGRVLNTIVLEDLAVYTPPSGQHLVPIEDGVTASIGWKYEDGTFVAPLQPAPPPPTAEEQQAARRAAYIAESDPLFFKAQRGEATFEEWQAKIEEIRDRYPLPVADDQESATTEN